MKIKNLRVFLENFAENAKYKLKGTKIGYASIDLPQSSNATFSEKHPFVPSVDFVSILKLKSKGNRNHMAIDCDSLHATYQQLIDDSHQLYLAYKKLGVKKGDIVTVSLPSNYQAITTFLALNELGAVTTFIDTYASEEEITGYLKKYNSPLFINYNKSEDDNERIKEMSGVNKIVTLYESKKDKRTINEPYNYDENDSFIDFHTLGNVAKLEKDSFHLPNKGSDTALILYTSGSSGQPKSVELTNENILSAQIYAGNTSHTENITGKKTMTCVPLRYPYGMVTSLLTSLLWGKEAIMTPEWDTNTVQYYFDKKPNIIFGSPAVLELAMKYKPKDGDTSFITHFISGGDFMTDKLYNRAKKYYSKFNNNHVEILNGFGNAENVSLGSTPVGVKYKHGSAGKLLVGTRGLVIDANIPDDMPIVDGDALEEKKYGQIGELCISGKNIFKRYIGEDYKTECAKFIRDGRVYFRTGTLGYLDDEGYFFPSDRKSRFYIRSTGHKVYLDNVQRIATEMDDRIQECAAVGIPHDEELFVNVLYVVLKDGIEPTEELKRELNDKFVLGVQGVDRFKEYEIPRYIEFVPEIPKISGAEKNDYKLLESQAKDKYYSEKVYEKK